MNQKRVAIIGAGISGLVCTKYALENDLKPVTFEKSSEIGGLWTANRTAIWSGMKTNVTKYVSTLSDHPWSHDTNIYPTSHQVLNYFQAYVKKYSLDEHIRLNHQVEFVRRLEDGSSWEVRYINLLTNEVKTDRFDFLIICSGIHSRARIPYNKDADKFKGVIQHSSQFK